MNKWNRILGKNAWVYIPIGLVLFVGIVVAEGLHLKKKNTLGNK